MPRPRAVSRSGDAVISNAELARIFNEIGDMLEILGEVVYKAVAYRRVADIVEVPSGVAMAARGGQARAHRRHHRGQGSWLPDRASL